MTRRLVSLCLACLVVGPWAVGCTSERVVGWQPHADATNLTETPDEHYHRVLRIEGQRRDALAEDLDLFFMTDRPTRLTRWHVK